MLQNVEETKLALQTPTPKASRMQFIMHRRPSAVPSGGGGGHVQDGTEARARRRTCWNAPSTSIQLGLGLWELESPRVVPASAVQSLHFCTATRGSEETTTTQRDGRPRHGTLGRSVRLAIHVRAM